MLKIRQLQLKVILDKQDCNKLIDDLSENYDLILYGIKRNYLEKLDLSLEEDSFIKEKLYPTDAQILAGDLIYLQPDSVMYYKINEIAERIEVGIIGGTNREEFKDFCDRVKTSIYDALEDPGVEWESVLKLDPSFKMLMDNARTITPDKEEIAAAEKLSDSNIKELMELINQQESIFLDKLKDKIQDNNLEEVVKTLEDLELISTDYSLLCSKTGQQILKVPDRSALEDMSKKGFKCFICGNSIADEKLERSISCSEFGDKMLSENYWFLILVIHALKEIGLDPNEIYVLTGEAPGTKIFLDINNEAMMLQIMDHKLTLDDAYLINAHVSAYRLKHVILLSSATFSNLMKSHLRETNPDCNINFIEGIDSLTAKIKEITVNNEKERLIRILKDYNPLTPVPIEDLIMKKIIPGGLIQPVTGLDELLYTESPEESIPIEEEIEETPQPEPEEEEEEVLMVEEEELVGETPEELGLNVEEEAGNEYYSTSSESTDVEDQIIAGVEEIEYKSLGEGEEEIKTD